MSSQFAIVKQKALERFGHVPVTSDAVYTNLISNIRLLNDTVGNLRNRISSLLRQYSELCVTSCEIARGLNGIYESSGRFMEAPSSLGLQKRKELRDELVPKLCKETQEQLLNELDSWHGDLAALDLRLREREKFRVRFDHYSRKINSLREANDRCLKRSKPYPKKEKLERNEKKLEDSRREFQQINEECISSMQKMWAGRFEGLDSSILKISEGEEMLSHILHVSMEQSLVSLQKAKDQNDLDQRRNRIEAAPSAGMDRDDSEGNERDTTEAVLDVFNDRPLHSKKVKSKKKKIKDSGETDLYEKAPVTVCDMAPSPEDAIDPFANPLWPAKIQTSSKGNDPFLESSPFADMSITPKQEELNLRSQVLDEWPTSTH